MGYYTYMTDADFMIPETPEVVAAIRDANTKCHDRKHGGTVLADGTTQKWFSWLPADYDQTITSAAELFRLLGFETQDEEGAFRLVGYDDKTGDEEVFLEVVAPFVAEGSHARFRGEDGTLYGYVVRDGVLVAHGDQPWAYERGLTTTSNDDTR
jgi:hypothetical protein